MKTKLFLAGFFTETASRLAAVAATWLISYVVSHWPCHRREKNCCIISIGASPNMQARFEQEFICDGITSPPKLKDR